MLFTMHYRHCTASGTPYEVGRALAGQLKNDGPLIQGLTTPLSGGAPPPHKQAEKTAALFDRYIPGINEEMRGFSEALNLCFLDLVIYSSYLGRLGGCSHLVFRDKGQDKSTILHARNYDYSFDESPLLLTLRTRGNHHNTGFGCKLFGRFDGMNDQGLCVTTSSVDVNHTGAMGEGFVFPMVVRAMLERCASVYEAKELLMELPYAEYRNFLLSDPSGDALLIEASPRHKACRAIGEAGFLCSADHFALEACEGIQPVRHSLIRQQQMERRLSAPAASAQDIRTLLRTRYPEGLAFPYYGGGMGTLWSVLYEPGARQQSVCFGSPEYGDWTPVDIQAATGCTQTAVPLRNAPAPDDLWM